MNYSFSIVLAIVILGGSICGIHSSWSGTTVKETIADSLLYINDADTRWHLANSDEAHFALLSPRMIVNEKGWRNLYSKQVLGFGVRTDAVELTDEDRETLKTLLLDPSNYVSGYKPCAMAGDAVAFFRDPYGEVTVVFELWCGRVHAFDGITLRKTWGNVDPVLSQLRSLAKKYFPNDEYLREELEKR